MPSNVEHPFLPRNDAPVPDETTITDLPVDGTLPAALSGRYMRIGPNKIGTPTPTGDWAAGEGMVHAVILHAGLAVSYRNRWITTDVAARKLGTEPAPGPRHAGPDVAATSVVAFGGSVLAFGDGALAYELTVDLATVRRVDLAGASRGLNAHPKLDPVTGELHLLAYAASPTQLHVTVSPGGLTRTSRPLNEPPSRINDFAVTRDHVVLLTDGFVGVTPRTGVDTHVTWIATGTDAAHLANVHDDGESVVVHVTSPLLERWTLDPAAATIQHDVLDATPQAFARSNEQRVGASRRYLWTVAAHLALKHDLLTADRDRHDFGPGRQPGELLFVVDPDRANDEDGGWLIGFVHDDARAEADLIVLDAQAINTPAVATVHIPRRIPPGLHGTWIPTTR